MIMYIVILLAAVMAALLFQNVWLAFLILVCNLAGLIEGGLKAEKIIKRHYGKKEK